MTIEINPEAYSTFDNCFPNVIEKVKRDNGQIIYGWKIHETSFLIEAERHAVWESENQKLIDITPDKSGARDVKFVLDNKDWKYDGQFTDNLRVNKTENTSVDDLILLSETLTKLYQTGRRGEQDQLLLLDKVLNVIQFLEADKLKRVQFICSGATPDNLCYCGQAIYKECHGKDLKSSFDSVLSHAKKIVDENASR